MYGIGAMEVVQLPSAIMSIAENDRGLGRKVSSDRWAIVHGS